MEDLLGLLGNQQFLEDPSQVQNSGESAKSGDEYVPDQVWLMCDKGLKPGRLTLLPRNVELYDENVALEIDLIPFVNIPSFVVCAIKGACTPAPIMWIDVMDDGVRVLGVRPLLETSKCLCGVGGQIEIYLTFGGIIKQFGNALTEVSDFLSDASLLCEIGSAVCGIAGVVCLATGVGAPLGAGLLAASAGLAEAGAVLGTAAAATGAAGALLTTGVDFIENPNVETGKALVGALWDAFGGKIMRKFLPKKVTQKLGVTDDKKKPKKPPKKSTTTRKSRANKNAKAIDKNGGHSHADHGSHTTKTQQEKRLQTGTAPSGRTPVDKKGNPIKPKTASKFDTDEKHLEAKGKADKELNDRIKAGTDTKKKEVVTVDVKDAGTSYKIDPNTGKTIETRVDKAKFVYKYNPQTGKYEVVTGYPE